MPTFHLNGMLLIWLDGKFEPEHFSKEILLGKTTNHKFVSTCIFPECFEPFLSWIKFVHQSICRHLTDAKHNFYQFRILDLPNRP